MRVFLAICYEVVAFFTGLFYRKAKSTLTSELLDEETGKPYDL